MKVNIKQCLLVIALVTLNIFVSAQEIKRVKTDFSDYLPLLNDAGYGVFAFDISSLKGEAYNISLVIREYVKGELVNDSEISEFESSVYDLTQKVSLGFSPKADSLKNVKLYVDNMRVAAGTLSLKPMSAPGYEGEYLYGFLPFKLERINVGGVTPLVLLGSYWYDKPFDAVRFYGEDDLSADMSAPFLKLIPHYYVLGIKVEALYRKFEATPQHQGNIPKKVG